MLVRSALRATGLKIWHILYVPIEYHVERPKKKKERETKLLKIQKCQISLFF